MIPNHTEERRKVLFDQRNNVSIVQSAKRYGAEATTFQSIERIVFYSLSCFPNDNQLDQFAHFHLGLKFTGHWEKTNTPMTGVEIAEMLTKIPEDITHWLMGNGPNLLPAGYGWDGKHTNSELVRAGKIKQLIIGNGDFKNITNEIIDTITEDVLVTPNSHLMQHWDQALSFTDLIYPDGRNENSQIFVFAQNNDVSVHIPVDNNIYSIDIHENYDRCIVVVTKYFHSDNYPNYGVSLKLYQRNKDETA